MELGSAGVGMALSVGAGLATGVGGLVVFFPMSKGLNKPFLAIALGASAGVMLFVSFVELFMESVASFERDGYRRSSAHLAAAGAFFLGCFIIRVLDSVTHMLVHAQGGGSWLTPHPSVPAPASGAFWSWPGYAWALHLASMRDWFALFRSGGDGASATTAGGSATEGAGGGAGAHGHSHSHGYSHGHGHAHAHPQARQSATGNATGGAARGERGAGGRAAGVNVTTSAPASASAKASKRSAEQPRSSDQRVAIPIPLADGASPVEDGKDGGELDDDTSSSGRDASPTDSVTGAGAGAGAGAGVGGGRGHAAASSSLLDEEFDRDAPRAEVSLDAPAWVQEMVAIDEHAAHLQKLGVLAALSIALHNLPEGAATFVGAIAGTSIGWVLAFSVALHNVFEGIAVAVPIYYATGSKVKAFLWALLSGSAEPIGSLVAWGALANTPSGTGFGIVFAVVAGMMVYVSLVELLPTAHRYDPSDRVVTKGFFWGMGLIALSIILME
jgi:zinc transporter ZupT